MIHLDPTGKVKTTPPLCCSSPSLGKRRLTLDRRPDRSAASAWKKARKAESNYAAKLRKIAKHIGDIVKGFDEGDIMGSLWIVTALRKYADTITPWAEAAARSMVTEVAAREAKQWRVASDKIGRALRQELATAETGAAARKAMADQVRLIRSMPLDAAQRVHDLIIEAAPKGTRSKALVEEIMRQGEVSRSKATLIARTETGRLSTELTKARAQAVGGEYFQWVTSRDGDVRDSHKKLDGKVFRWDDPPECDPGHRALPGAIWNCRCVAVPILNDEQ